GVALPVFVEEKYFDFTDPESEPVDPAVFPDYASAAQAVSAADVSAEAKPYAYYRGAGGAVIAPTLFTSKTAPRVIHTALEARRQLARYVQDEMASLALSMIGAKIISGVIKFIVRVSG